MDSDIWTLSWSFRISEWLFYYYVILFTHKLLRNRRILTFNISDNFFPMFSQFIFIVQMNLNQFLNFIFVANKYFKNFSATDFWNTFICSFSIPKSRSSRSFSFWSDLFISINRDSSISSSNKNPTTHYARSMTHIRVSKLCHDFEHSRKSKKIKYRNCDENA